MKHLSLQFTEFDYTLTMAATSVSLGHFTQWGTLLSKKDYSSATKENMQTAEKRRTRHLLHSIQRAILGFLCPF